MNQLKYVMLMYKLQGFIHFQQQKLDVQLFIGLKDGRIAIGGGKLFLLQVSK